MEWGFALGDATVDIARSFGAKITSFDWCEDFAAARNASLAMSSRFARWPRSARPPSPFEPERSAQGCG
jgi:hypothetical protein